MFNKYKHNFRLEWRDVPLGKKPYILFYKKRGLLFHTKEGMTMWTLKNYFSK